METTANVLTIENLEQVFAKKSTEIENAVKATLHDFTSSWDKKMASYRVDAGPEKPADLKAPAAEPEAELEDSSVSRTLNKVTDFEIAGIPVGSALVGGFAAIFVTELIDGWLAAQSTMVRGLVKLGGAFVVVKYANKWIGKDIANVVALLMTFDALKNDIMPGIFNYATTWANKITNTTTVAGLGHTGGNVVLTSGSPASRPGDYYSASGLG